VGIFYVLVSGISFGLLPWFARIAYDHGADPLGILIARFSLATVGLVIIRVIYQRGVAWPPGKTLLQLVGLGAFGYAGQSSFYFFGIERIDISLATVIFYSYPVFVVLAGWALWGTKPSVRVSLCLAIVIAGTALTAGQVRAGSFTGVLLMLGASGWYTIYIVIASKLTPKVGALTSLTAIMGGTAAAHLLAWPLHQSSLPTDAIGWGHLQVPCVVLRQRRDPELVEGGIPWRQHLRPVHAILEPKGRVLEIAPRLAEERGVDVHVLPTLGARGRLDVERAGEPIGHLCFLSYVRVRGHESADLAVGGAILL